MVNLTQLVERNGVTIHWDGDKAFEVQIDGKPVREFYANTGRNPAHALMIARDRIHQYTM